MLVWLRVNESEWWRQQETNRLFVLRGHMTVFLSRVWWIWWDHESGFSSSSERVWQKLLPLYPSRLLLDCSRFLRVHTENFTNSQRKTIEKASRWQRALSQHIWAIKKCTFVFSIVHHPIISEDKLWGKKPSALCEWSKKTLVLRDGSKHNSDLPKYYWCQTHEAFNFVFVQSVWQ